MQEQVQEFTIKAPVRDSKKSFHIMKFNSSLKVDTTMWTQVRMIRENNKKDFRGADEEMPKFGAGSEFGREQREEARRKRYGISSRKYDPGAQPWLMRVGSKKEGTAKQYKGVREGGVAENASYYVFTHAEDGSFEAHPVGEWYNFTPKVTYKTLDAEEAEEKFAERGKILNHWAVMVNRRVKGGDGEEEDDPDEGPSKGKKGKSKGKDFKISDMDDWVESGDEMGSEDDDKDGGGSDDEDGKKKKGANNKRSKDSKKKNKSKEAKEEGFEDSDDGDGEGREVDYMEDESSESEEELNEQANQKGVDQDHGLAKMLDSDFSSEDEDKDKEKNEDDNDDDDEDPDKPGKKKSREDGEGKRSKGNSRSVSPAPKEDEEGGGDSDKAVRAEKRKALVDSLLDPNAADGSGQQAKRSRMDGASGSIASSSSSSAASSLSAAEVIFEENVRRYLARKPMTTTDLLKKVREKKTGIPNATKEELMSLVARTVKRINPHKQKVRGQLYLSLKKSGNFIG